MIISLGFAWRRLPRATAHRAIVIGFSSARFKTDTILSGVLRGKPLAVEPSPVASRIVMGRAGIARAAIRRFVRADDDC